MRLLLVRHGQSTGNSSGVIQGHLDFELSELGLQQARATAKRLADEQVDRIVSSPLRRAVDTAGLIAESLGLAVETDPALLEYNIGMIAGLTGAQVRERHPEVVEAYRRGERPVLPGEEGRDVFLKRVSGALEVLRESGQTVVAVAHGGVIGAFCYTALGLDYRLPGMFEVANCSITEIRLDRSGRLVLQRHNDTCHLGELTTVLDAG